jgi:3-hydroxybutyryl-CoA dehydratase
VVRVSAGTEPKQENAFYNADVVMDRPFDLMVEGDRFRSRGRTITEADVVNFACLTGDWHPAHTNRRWAEKNIFGERVAHGMLLLSFAIGLVPNTYVVALRRLKNVTYKTPVRFGDTVFVEGKVHRLKPFSEEVGMVTALWKLVNQKDETCAKMEFEMLWQRGWA